jgi:hypothetical protein
MLRLQQNMHAWSSAVWVAIVACVAVATLLLLLDCLSKEKSNSLAACENCRLRVSLLFHRCVVYCMVYLMPWLWWLCMLLSFQELYGDSVAGAMLNALSRLLTAFLQHNGFTCGMDDLLLVPTAEAARAMVRIWWSCFNPAEATAASKSLLQQVVLKAATCLQAVAPVSTCC